MLSKQLFRTKSYRPPTGNQIVVKQSWFLILLDLIMWLVNLTMECLIVVRMLVQTRCPSESSVWCFSKKSLARRFQTGQSAMPTCTPHPKPGTPRPGFLFCPLDVKGATTSLSKIQPLGPRCMRKPESNVLTCAHPFAIQIGKCETIWRIFNMFEKRRSGRKLGRVGAGE